MTTATIRPARSAILDCIRLATSAPSLHNSQPWRFRLRESSLIDVYADPERRLQILDPDGREQLISVGAAVLTLRLALRRAGYATDVDLLPGHGRSDRVARVVVTHATAITPELAALAEAVPYRHTNRWPFARTPVPPAVLDQLRDAARTEGAVLAAALPGGREAILNLAWSADRLLRERPGYCDELARWTGRDLRHDGVPASAAGPWDVLESVPVRDFTLVCGVPRKPAQFEPHPTILVLATTGDHRLDWVRAGQALQRVLLTLTWQGLAATPIGQPIEVPEVRRLLIEPGAGLWPQMVLRVGYGTATGRTPRRPLSDVLGPAGRQPRVPRRAAT